MSFLHLPAGWVIAGLAALAAGLFALQRLRVRHRDVTVITTMFWAEAVRESRARVLVDRFRHPLAYLLILAAASLLWIGAAGPRLDGGAGRDHVVLLDASARMGRTGRFAAAVESLREDVAALPRDRTRVVLCGDGPRTLLLPGENALLLDERLAGVAPDASAESVTRTIHEVTSVHDGPLTVWLHGDAPLPAEGALGDDVEIVRAGPGPVDATSNAGITALGVSDARSGAWTTVDLLVEVRGQPLPATDSIRVTTSAPPLPDPIVERSEDRVVLRYSDVPANGATVTAAIASDDALDLDNSADVKLPDRRPIRVAAPEDAPGALLDVLRTDRAVRLVPEGDAADVRVIRGDIPTEGAPALVLTTSGDTFWIGRPGYGSADAVGVARTAVSRYALDRIDATGLATEAGRPITAGAGESAVPVVAVWEELLTDRYDFIADDAFPAFVGAAVRDFADVDASISQTPGLVSPDETLAAGAASDAERSAAGSTPADLAAWAGLLGAVLLAAEWILHRRGRIP